MVPHRDIPDALADSHDPPHGFVPERHGQRPDPGAVHHGKIRMAQAGVGNGHSQLTGTRFGPVQFLNH
jgi:hypothetical protein